MNSKFNKKKIRFFPNQKLLKYLFIIILISFSFIFIYYELIRKDSLKNYIQNLSEKFNYQFNNLEINNLKRVDKSDVVKITNKYYGQSIFLIPLKEISKSINELRWVKNVNLSTNFKNKVSVEIFEYKPVALLFYNDQLFYFSSNGKVIDKFREENNENFIIFYGKQVLKHANNFINILDKIKIKNNVKEAHYINERRWDIKLHNEIILNLAEKNIEESINNYIKLIKKLNDYDILTIKSIDLRNNKKAIISFK